MKPHDVVTIPRARMVYVLGNVSKPGGYVLTDNETMSITKAIALAGGWDKTASLAARGYCAHRAEQSGNRSPRM